MSSSSPSLRNVTATPVFPARPVRPAQGRGQITKSRGQKGAGQRTDPVNVSLDRVRHLEVDDERDVGHVDTATGEVGRYEDVALARADRVERRLALLLVLARVQCCHTPLSERGGGSGRVEVGGKEEEDARERVGGPS